MAKLSEKHPIEAEAAKALLAPYRAPKWSARYPGGIDISQAWADDLEMKICEALYEAFQRGHYDGLGAVEPV